MFITLFVGCHSFHFTELLIFFCIFQVRLTTNIFSNWQAYITWRRKLISTLTFSSLDRCRLNLKEENCASCRCGKESFVQTAAVSTTLYIKEYRNSCPYSLFFLSDLERLRHRCSHNSLSSCELRAILHSTNLILLRGGKGFLSVLNSPVSDLCEIRSNKSTHNSVDHFRFPWKWAHGEP